MGTAFLEKVGFAIYIYIYGFLRVGFMGYYVAFMGYFRVNMGFYAHWLV